MSNEKNVFISHYNKHDEHVQNLKDLLGRAGYVIKNSSIDSTKPNRVISDEAIRRLLRMRISWAGVFICLVGEDTHTRPWVDWEIEQAKNQGKRILGVYIYGAKEDAVIPKNLDKHGDCLTGWNTDKIIEWLDGTDIGWSEPNGSTREPVRELIRASCN